MSENSDENKDGSFEMVDFPESSEENGEEFFDAVQDHAIKGKEEYNCPPGPGASKMSATTNTQLFDKVDFPNEVCSEDVSCLMKRATEIQYEVTLEKDDYISSLCSEMMKREYRVNDLYNMESSESILSKNYPKTIFIPVAVRVQDPNSSNEWKYYENTAMEEFKKNFKDYKILVQKSNAVRCHTRFPVPVILYKRKFICRSGTIAVQKTATYQAITKPQGPDYVTRNVSQNYFQTISNACSHVVSNIMEATNIVFYGLNGYKKEDVELLQMLGISYICDLMVENRKVHTGMNVSSSEKINKSTYKDFICISIPYPGCEFFTKYSEIRKSENYSELQKNLIFDWKNPNVDAKLVVSESEDSLSPIQEINWEKYQTWDLTTLTKNYIRLLLYYIDEGDGGILIHCISGWDRTPLFISLIRISLWADDLIHKELDVIQMAYFTIAYDWYLFGHNLPNRLEKREEIMHFCFKFLPEIASEEYSLRKKTEETTEDFLKVREERITKISKVLIQAYEENVKLPESDQPKDAN